MNALDGFRRDILLETDLDLIAEAVRDLRRDIWFLEATFADTFETQTDLLIEVKRLAQRARLAYGVEVQFELHDVYLVPHSLSYHLKMIITEGVYNALMHSKADHILVTLAILDSTVSLTIRDNGTGFDFELIRPSGLQNIQMRAEEQLNGSYQVTSQVGEGTEISVKIPIQF